MPQTLKNRGLGLVEKCVYTYKKDFTFVTKFRIIFYMQYDRKALKYEVNYEIIKKY